MTWHKRHPPDVKRKNLIAILSIYFHREINNAWKNVADG
jgi:hypothetical protein